MSEFNQETSYCLSQLKSRGWTPLMIDELLVLPDALQTNPKYKSAAPMKLFSMLRVKWIEQQAEFLWLKRQKENRQDFGRKKNTSLSHAKNIKKNEDRLLEVIQEKEFFLVAQHHLENYDMPLKAEHWDYLSFVASRFYHRYKAQHEFYDPTVSPTSPPEILNPLIGIYLFKNRVPYCQNQNVRFFLKENGLTSLFIQKKWECVKLDLIAQCYPQLQEWAQSQKILYKTALDHEKYYQDYIQSLKNIIQSQKKEKEDQKESRDEGNKLEKETSKDTPLARDESLKKTIALLKKIEKETLNTYLSTGTASKLKNKEAKKKVLGSLWDNIEAFMMGSTLDEASIVIGRSLTFISDKNLIQLLKILPNPIPDSYLEHFILRALYQQNWEIGDALLQQKMHNKMKEKHILFALDANQNEWASRWVKKIHSNTNITNLARVAIVKDNLEFLDLIKDQTIKLDKDEIHHLFLNLKEFQNKAIFLWIFKVQNQDFLNVWHDIIHHFLSKTKKPDQMEIQILKKMETISAVLPFNLISQSVFQIKNKLNQWGLIESFPDFHRLYLNHALPPEGVPDKTQKKRI